MNTRCEPWYQNRFALIRTHSVRTQWFALSGDAHHGNARVALVRAVQSSLLVVEVETCGVLYPCSRTFRMMEFHGLLIGLLTFAIVSDSFFGNIQE